MGIPKRVSILGAGPAGLSTAWELSSQKDAGGNPLYDVTVYDMSWRPGGKCASSRANQTDRRIVQNGTHYLFGVYFNLFKIIRDAYVELNGGSGASDQNAGWGGTDEFVSRRLIALKDGCGPKGNWVMEIPCKDGGELPSGGSSDAAADIFSLVLDVLDSFTLPLASGLVPIFNAQGRYALHRVLSTEIKILSPVPFERDDEVARLFSESRELARHISIHGRLKPGVQDSAKLNALQGQLQRRVERLRPRMLRSIKTAAQRSVLLSGIACALRRFAIATDFGLTLMRAMLDDDILLGGVSSVERFDFRDWLSRHGLEPSTRASPLTLAWYDAVAAYTNGDAGSPKLSAAAFLQGIVPAALTYRGCFLYQMVGEVGENFAGPVYEVLQRRGVKFRWMHRVSELILSADNRRVERVRFSVPVPGPSPLGAAAPPDYAALRLYDPSFSFTLANGKTRNAFPAQPKPPFDFLVPASPPASLWYTWPPTSQTSTVSIENVAASAPDPMAQDRYDILVFALPHTVISHVASALCTQSAAWDRATTLPSVETRSLRLWLRPTFDQLQWDDDHRYDRPVLATFRSKFFVWEDSGQQIAVHTWPVPADTPKSIATVFAPHPAPAVAPHPAEAPGYVTAQHASAVTVGEEFLNDEAGSLWFGAASGAGLDPTKVVPAPPGGGASTSSVPGLVDAAYVIANAGPLERYVHAAPGTYDLRIDPFSVGFDGLFVAGDWVKLWPALGNMEQAIISGRVAGLRIGGKTAAQIAEVVPNFPGFFAT